MFSFVYNVIFYNVVLSLDDKVGWYFLFFSSIELGCLMNEEQGVVLFLFGLHVLLKRCQCVNGV